MHAGRSGSTRRAIGAVPVLRMLPVSLLSLATVACSADELSPSSEGTQGGSGSIDGQIPASAAGRAGAASVEQPSGAGGAGAASAGASSGGCFPQMLAHARFVLNNRSCTTKEECTRAGSRCANAIMEACDGSFLIRKDYSLEEEDALAWAVEQCVGRCTGGCTAFPPFEPDCVKGICSPPGGSLEQDAADGDCGECELVLFQRYDALRACLLPPEPVSCDCNYVPRPLLCQVDVVTGDPGWVPGPVGGPEWLACTPEHEKMLEVAQDCP
jgi:hypothetical protein